MIDINSLNLNRLSLAKLLEIARRDETEVVELKDNILKPNEISDYVAQFCNNRGGLLIFGCNDDSTPSGKIRHYDKTNEISIQEGALTTTPSVPIQIKAFNVLTDRAWL